MKLRRAIQRALDTLALADPNPAARLGGVKAGQFRQTQYLPVLQDRLAIEPNARCAGRSTRPSPCCNSTTPTRPSNWTRCGGWPRPKRSARSNAEAPGCRDACVPRSGQGGGYPVSSIAGHITWVNFFGTVFRGLSLGSILLVVTLGLAITFGLMGIINMAHGEMIAVGAYTTYLVQNLFGAGFAFSITLPISFWGKPLAFGLHLPGLNATGAFYETYFLFALPLEFLSPRPPPA